MGDSHAMNWQAPLDVAAQANGWRVLAITPEPLPLLARSQATARARPVGLRALERAHHALVPAPTPEIGVAFFAQMNGGRATLLTGGDQFAAAVAGYRRAWRALPPSVDRIVVIRGSAQRRGGHAPLRDARRRAPPLPGATCALARAEALPPDPAVAAAAGMRRVQVVDLTPHMCDRRRCFPVVGGVLVHKDGSHLTTPFATSLGPFLLRSVERLLG